MTPTERIGIPSVVIGVAGLAALWPLSAYFLGPAVLPAVVAVVAAALLVMRRPEYGIAFVLTLAPLWYMYVPSAGVAGPVFTRPFPFVLGAVAILVLVYGSLISVFRTSRPNPEARRIVAAAFLLVAVMVLSILWVVDPTPSVRPMYIALGAVVCIAVVRICRRREQLHIVVGGALGGLVLAALQGVVQHYAGYFQEGFAVGATAIGRAQGSFDHPNHFGTYVALLLPLAAATTWRKDLPSWLRWLGLAGLVFGVPAIVFSYSRGSIAALAVASVLWLLFFRPRMALTIAAIMAVGAVTLAPSTLKERFSSSSDQADAGLRSEIWRGAIDVTSNHPVLGVGVENFPQEYERLHPRPGVHPELRIHFGNELNELAPPHAHSMYLNLLAETGVVGTFAFLLLVIAAVSAAYRGSRVRDPANRAICMAVGIGLVMLLIDGIVHVPIYNPESTMVLFALLGVSTVFVQIDRREHEEAEEAGL